MCCGLLQFRPIAALPSLDLLLQLQNSIDQSVRRGGAAGNGNVDRNNLVGSVDLIGATDSTTGAIVEFGSEHGLQVLAERPTPAWLQADSRLPDDTRLWAALQSVSGGTWGGSVYDVERILQVLKAGEAALRKDVAAVDH